MLISSSSKTAQLTKPGFASERLRSKDEITRAVASKEPSQADLSSFPLRQTWIALTSSMQPIRLLEPAILEADSEFTKITVRGWNIEREASKQNLADIPRQMARQFMRLWQTAEHGELTEPDKIAWSHIVAHVDMDAFYRSIEQPRYLEAQLCGSRGQWYVRWPGEDSSERIPAEFNGEFRLMEKDEWFGAWFLFHADSSIRKVERVRPITPPADDLLENWPTVAE